MYLSVNNVSFYLFERGLLTFGEYRAGISLYRETNGRNFGLQVTMHCGKCFFVKQCKSNNPESRKVLEKEAAFYTFIKTAESGLSKRIPSFYLYDPRYAILVLSLIPDAKRLRETDDLSVDLGQQLAETLIALHTGRLFETAPVESFVPWILNVSKSDIQHWLLHRKGVGTHALTQQILSRKTLINQLSDLAGQWHSSQWCHGDVKFENVLVTEAETNKTQIWLIDWEEIGWGDALWDVAGIIQSFIAKALLKNSFLIYSPFSPFDPILDNTALKRQTVSFWQTYTKTSGASFSELKVIRYVGALFLLRLFEYAHLTDATSKALELLPLAEKLITRPEQFISLLKND